MPNYVQADRPLILTTPLAADTLLAMGLSASEGISQLFHYQIDCMAERGTAIDFSKLLGQKVSLKLEVPPKKERFFSGLCVRFTQGDSDPTFDQYRMEVAPPFWLLTKRTQSRIFQHITVPDILKAVLTGLDVTFEIQGKFEQRDYCVQYRETDFNFASRLMEEEGIYYFFKHTAGGAQMVVANMPQSHSDLTPVSALDFKMLTQGAAIDNVAIYKLRKTQEMTSGKFLLWDHTFELPHKHLEADKPITDSIQAGKVNHKLKVGDNGKLEIYDWPGEYAQRFDGVNRSGGDQPADLQKIFEDNKRTVGLRMEAAVTGSVLLHGSSNYRHLTPGFKVSVKAIDDVSQQIGADGSYVLTAVNHSAQMGADYRSGNAAAFTYDNSFTLMPAAAPFRPQRITPKPVVAGTQSAVVVGPKGEEIFTDRYGRVKVQFHWDRQGKYDADSSCWVRVTQPWAGKRWGAFFIPRIGQEIIIDFLEGDPDQPICVGCVYNPDQPHPYLGDGPDTANMNNHKQNPRVMGVKSNSTPGGAGFNEWRFDDTKGKEQIFIHAQRDKDLRVNNDRREIILHDTHLIVGGQDKNGNKVGDQTETIWQDKHQTVHRNHSEQVMGNVQYTVGHGDASAGGNVDIVIEKNKQELIENDSHLTVQGDKLVVVGKSQQVVIGAALATSVGANSDLAIGGQQVTSVGSDKSLSVGGKLIESVGKDASLDIGGNQVIKVGASQSLSVGKSHFVKVSSDYALEAKTVSVKADDSLVIEAANELTLKCGGCFINMKKDGTMAISGTMVNVNSGGAPGQGTPSTPGSVTVTITVTKAKQALKAVQAKPNLAKLADAALSGQKSAQ